MARLFDDASTQYLTVASTPVTGPPLTMCAWAYFDTLPTVADAEMHILTLHAGGVQHRFSISGSKYVSNNLVFDVRNGVITSMATTTVAPSVNTWFHVCGVARDVDDREVYINAGNSGTSSVDNQPNAATDIEIGSLFGGNSSISGMVAEAAIWNVALTAAEVAVLATGVTPLAVRPQSLVAYWPLINEDDDDPVGGYDMTPVNSPTWAAHPRVRYFPLPSIGRPSAAAAALSINLAADNPDSWRQGVRVY